MNSQAMTLRRASEIDLESIADIYNEAVDDRVATCDLSDVAPDGLEDWLHRHREPWGVWVCEDEHVERILGWVCISPYDTKPCFRRTATFATYVTRAARGQGVGSALREHMIRAAGEAGFHTMVNRVWSNNAESIALAEKFGFEQVGHMRDLVFVDGSYVDCLFFQLNLD